MVHLARAVLVAGIGLVGTAAAAQQCCLADVSTYCTAGTTVHGCVPSISGVGTPSATASNGFEIVVSIVPGQRYGTLYYGFYQNITPWAPGSLSYQCIASPVQRLGIFDTGGTAGQCNGELRLDFNAWRAANPGALGSPFVAGQVFQAQGWFRDPGAPKQTNLSNALRFVLGQCPSSPPGMVLIPAGTFQMGSNAAGGPPYYGDSSSQPVHQVAISYCFWMGATEVTQAQYSALMGTNPSYLPGANNPVEQVSWFNAQAYCAALTAQQAALGNVPAGYQYRLPTDAEWEYACRAGTTTEFNVGASLFCNQAKFWSSYHSNSNCNPSGTVPVGSHAPNAWGLHDLHGNVREWCLDSYANYSAGSVTNPFVTGGLFRVFRGGGWRDFSPYCRSPYRGGLDPASAHDYIGFRVVLGPILVP